MTNILRALLFTTLIMPSAAFASLYTFEYSGKLTDRVTPGFDFPERINGVLAFDMHAGIDTHPDPFSSHYSIREGYSDFVTGYIPTNSGINNDAVRFYNGFNAPGNSEPWWDAFDVYDSNIVDRLATGLFLIAYVKDLDWLSDDTGHPLFFSNYLAFEGTGMLTQYEYWIGADGDAYARDIASAYYDLDFARLSIVNISVTEPAAPILMMLGLLGALVRFRRR